MCIRARLHTYSRGEVDFSDKAVVFYSPHAVKIKQLKEVTHEQIANVFQRDDLIIYTNPQEFKEFLFNQNLEKTTVVLMSSGNYGGLDFEEVMGLV